MQHDCFQLNAVQVYGLSCTTTAVQLPKTLRKETFRRIFIIPDNWLSITIAYNGHFQTVSMR